MWHVDQFARIRHNLTVLQLVCSGTSKAPQQLTQRVGAGSVYSILWYVMIYAKTVTI